MTRTNDNVNIERGLILSELLAKYEPMVQRLVHNFKLTNCINAVCSREDLEQEGRMAIIKAYDSYDESKEASLNTWVYHMVKDAMLEYRKRTFSHFKGGSYLYGHIRALEDEGKEITIENLRARGVSRSTAAAAFYFNMRPSTYGECLNLADPNAVKPFAELEGSCCDYKERLDYNERFILERHFGLNGRRPETMEEIGADIGKSRKAVSYIINKTVVKLRHLPGIEAHYEILKEPR